MYASKNTLAYFTKKHKSQTKKGFIMQALAVVVNSVRPSFAKCLKKNLSLNLTTKTKEKSFYLK